MKLTQNNMDKLIVICLSENMEENRKVANVQIECIKFDVNLIVCFDI